MSADALKKLVAEPPKVVNVGLKGFADVLSARGVETVHVDWSPPAGGDPELADLLAKLGT